jgi:dihydroceramidase
MWTMIAVGLSIFLGGFGMWNLDIIYCGKLRQWRHQVGLPWGILLEGHGWWYVFSSCKSFESGREADFLCL